MELELSQMNKMPLIALVGMLSLSSAVSAEEEFSYTAKVGADMWWGSTKLNEVRQDEDSNSPSVYFAFEHNAPMLPNASITSTTTSTSPKPNVVGLMRPSVNT